MLTRDVVQRRSGHATIGLDAAPGVACIGGAIACALLAPGVEVLEGQAGSLDGHAHARPLLAR